MTITAHTAHGKPTLSLRSVGAGLLLLALGIAIGVLAGRDEGGPGGPTVHVGSGYVGVNVASLTAGDHFYVSVQPGVPWFDARGARQEGTWPSCLPRTTEVHGIRWADVPVTGPDGSTERTVLYVDCSRR